jgi:hypothetical protein
VRSHTLRSRRSDALSKLPFDIRLTPIERWRRPHGPELPCVAKAGEGPVNEKLGENSRLANDLRNLSFYYFTGNAWQGDIVETVTKNRMAFAEALNVAVGIPRATQEANPVAPSAPSGQSLVQIHQVGPSATADARAEVSVNITSDQLRQIIATFPGLSSEERGEGVASVPDEGESIDLNKAD